MSELRTEVLLDSYPENPVPAIFKEMRKATSNGSLSFRVTLTMEVPEHMHVFPGMNANVRTVLAGDKNSSAEQTLVPLGALFSKEDISLGEGQQFVWVVDDANRVNLREIKVSRLLSNGAVIEKGVSEGERVIAAGTHHVKDQQVVRALTRERGL